MGRQESEIPWDSSICNAQPQLSYTEAFFSLTISFQGGTVTINSLTSHPLPLGLLVRREILILL